MTGGMRFSCGTEGKGTRRSCSLAGVGRTSLDVKILLQTPGAVPSGDGAHWGISANG